MTREGKIALYRVVMIFMFSIAFALGLKSPEVFFTSVLMGLSSYYLGIWDVTNDL